MPVSALQTVPGLPQPGRTLVIGVVNVTPDSFSDGGEWFDPEAAIAHGQDLIEQGADIVEVGGESTRPGAVRPSMAEELRRVLPVVRALAGVGCVSIDTMRAEVAGGGDRRRGPPGQRRVRRPGRPGDAAPGGRGRPALRLHALAGSLRGHAEPGACTPTWWPRWSPS